MSPARLLPGAEHFHVTELPAYPACGEGEHLYLELETRRLGSDRVAALLARVCQVPRRAVGYAGRKDRHAVSRQWFSVHGADAATLDALPTAPDGGALEVRSITRHRNKLRLGHLAGNRFRLGLELEPGDEAQLGAGLAEVERAGFANRFGAQRFGIGGGNIAIACAWGRGDDAAALALIVSPDGDWQPGDPLPGGRSFGARGAVLRALRGRPDDAAGALRAAGRAFRQLIASAAQSAIFNAVLEARRAAGLLHVLCDGDLARLGRGPLFLCTAEELDDANRRAAPGVLEVFATGPLPGRSRFAPGPEVAAEERAWSEPTGIDWSWLAAGALSSAGARRELIARCLEPPRLETDATGTWLSIALPPGSYATQLLEELGISVPERRAG